MPRLTRIMASDAGTLRAAYRGRIRDVWDLRRQARGRCGIAARRGERGSTRFNRGGSSAGGVSAVRGRARPIRRCEVGIHGWAGSSGADWRRGLARRGADRCKVRAGARPGC